MARSFKGLDHMKELQGAMEQFDTKWNFQAAGHRSFWWPTMATGGSGVGAGSQFIRGITKQKEEDDERYDLPLISALTQRRSSAAYGDGVIKKSGPMSLETEHHLHSNASNELKLLRSVERKLVAVSHSSPPFGQLHRTASDADLRKTSTNSRGPHLLGPVVGQTFPPPPPPFLPILTVPNASVYPSHHFIQQPLIQIYRPYLPTLPSSTSASNFSLNLASTLCTNVPLQSSAFLNATTSLLQLKLDRCSRTEVLTTSPFRFPNGYHTPSNALQPRKRSCSYLFESVSKFCAAPSPKLHKFRSPSLQTKPTSDSVTHPAARRRLVNWLIDSTSNRKCQSEPKAATTEAPITLPVGVKTGPGSRFRCDRCGKIYATLGGLDRHKDFHCIAGDDSLPSVVTRNFSCKQCSKVYSSLGAMKMHTRTHTLPCKCQVCGKAFSRPWLLQGHLRTHTGEKPFGCSHCGRAFADRSNLRAHLQTHAEVKKYSCNACTKTFSRLSLLVKHRDNSCPQRRQAKKSNALAHDNQLQTWS